MSTKSTNSGYLITRRYGDFKGLDCRDGEISLNRSPDTLNMWRNYKSSNMLETRPDIVLSTQFDNPVYGLFFYEVSNQVQLIVHSGTKLYKIVNGTKTELTLPTGVSLKPARNYFFVHNNILYYKDGLCYLKYNGTTLTNIVDDDNTYIPRTTIGKSPSGGGTSFQYANTLSRYRRNDFTADGQSLVYQLDATNITGVKSVYVNDTLYSYVASDPGENEYTVDTTAGTVIFGVAPESPNTDGQDNVFITYAKVESANTDAILKCTLLAEFDNKIFFSGNQDYPNAIWYSGGVGAADDVTYVPFNQFYNEGLDNSPVRALVPGNNALWVFKEPSQANTTVFYHIPTTVYENGISINTYPSVHSSISTGCIATGLNFADDIVFYSDRGLEGITGDVTTEQLLAHRSTFVDNKLLKETNYKNMILEEYDGYMLTFINDSKTVEEQTINYSKIYLTDSRQASALINHYEYDWYYWEIDKPVRSTRVKDGVLYLGCDDGIYILDGTPTTIESYWTTPMDTFGQGNYQKITNKRGCIIECEGEEISVSVKTSKDAMALINTYPNISDYVVSRIKRKKFKDIQIKIHSTKPMKLQSLMLECYIGNYIKR